jgi:LPS-assembly lipoprotein
MNRRTLPLLALALLLPACGLKPVYSGGSDSLVTRTLDSVEIGPIAGKAGWIMTQQLGQRLGRGGSTYRLDVALDDQLTSFGISKDNSASRERRTLRARFQLIENATGKVVLDQTASADAGIDLTQSDYATIAAEETVLERLSIDLADQITTRLALFAQRQPNP